MNSRLIAHVADSFRHHTSLMLATLFVLTGSFFVSGGLLLAGQNMNKILTLWGDSLQMSVYLKDGATREQSDRLGHRLSLDKRIQQAKWVSREMALAEFQTQMASYAPDLLKDPQLLQFIPQSFQVQLSETIPSEKQLETLTSLAEDLKGEDVVEDVSYGQEWVKTYASIVGTFTSLGTWIVLLLTGAALFIVSNSVSSSIQQRRSEIEVFELVGASKSFIRAPFLFEGLFLGGLSSALAMSLLGFGFLALKGRFHDQIAFLQLSHHLRFFSFWGIAGLAATGMAIGVASAYLSLRKLNDGWAASRARQGD